MNEIPASEFDAREFDAREVVQRYKKLVPLHQLQRSLRAQHAATRQELVELINEKYADFVSLSSRMQGVEAALKPLRAPLEESSEMTRALLTKLGGILGEAEETQQALACIRARKDALNAYVDSARLLDRAKAAVGQQRGNPQESDDFLREYVMQENIARDLRRIRLNLGGGLQSPPQSAAAGATGGGLVATNFSEGAASGVGQATDATAEEPAAEETSPECHALLQEEVDIEKTFAGRLRERLEGLARAVTRSWEEAGHVAVDSEMPGRGQPVRPPRTEVLAIAHVCRALVALGRANIAEDTFAEVFVKGSLEQATAACTGAAEETQRSAMAGDNPATAGGGGAGVPLCIGAGAVNLGPFFDALRASLLKEGTPLLWLAQRLRGSVDAADGDAESALLAVPSLRLVSNGLAVPVIRHVQQVWPNVFMPAFPDVFATNFSHASAFIQAVEALMPAAERLGFMQGTALIDFQRRWKTQVYSSLRGKEAVQRLATAAAQACSSERLEGDLFLPASAELMRLLGTIWGDRWYLEVIYMKMVQLSLDLLSRYSKLMRGFASTWASVTPGNEKGAGPGGWDASAGKWFASSPLAQLTRASSDALRVLAALAPEGRVERFFLGRSASAQGPWPRELVRGLVQETAEVLRPSVEELEAALLKEIAAATAPQFAFISGIPALYRFVNKPVPTKASPYVEAALRPVFALREMAAGVTPEDALAGWLRRAVDSAAMEFETQAAQLLESTRQQEASLKRLGGRGGGDKVSDLDKIHIQLCLDAEAFTVAAAPLGANDNDGCLAKLAEVLAPVRPTYEAHRVPPS